MSNSSTTSFTFDGEWGSAIKPAGSSTVTNEGSFVCLEDSSTGLLNGKFVPVSGGGTQSHIVGGKHDPPAVGGTKHRVTIIRDDGTDVHVYTGVITDQGGGNFKVNGRRLKITKPTAEPLSPSGGATAAVAPSIESGAASGGGGATEGTTPEAVGTTPEAGGTTPETGGKTVETALAALTADDDEWIGTRPPT